MAEAGGRFITVEGGEGAGKSTQILALGAFLEEQGVPVTITREPGGTFLGERVRGVLLDPEVRGMDDLAELLLVFAARAQHITEVIQPALAAGRWVLCDRFTDASYAYQGGGRGLGATPIATLETLVQGALRPDRVIVLDLPVADGLTRASQRGTADRFELEQQAFFERVREVYLARARNAPDRYRVVDARPPIAEVTVSIRGALADLL